MQEAETENWYWYKITEQGGICLFRVFGTLPEIFVPETLFGKTVTELGSYCFSETEKAGEDQMPGGDRGDGAVFARGFSH